MIDFTTVLTSGSNLRIHGNGFLQIDLDLGAVDPGTERLHIFGHPALPRQKVPTPIHDHRFGFDSMVVKGRLVNVNYMLAPQDARDVTHKVYEPSSRIGEDTMLKPTGEAGVLVATHTQVVMPGDMYSIEAKRFHESLTNEVTITHMRKQYTTGHRARVLVPVGYEPDNDFTRYDMEVDAMWEIVREAFA